MIRRTYQCEECEQFFTVDCRSDDPDPKCPNPACDQVLQWRPQGFAIGGSVESKAVDYTQKVMEEDYGLSNFKDNVKPGETGIVRRQETKVETEMVEREMREQFAAIAADPQKTAQFWGTNTGTPTTMGSATGQSMIQMAKVGPQGPDPMAMLHSRAKRPGSKTSDMISEGYRASMDNPARKQG